MALRLEGPDFLPCGQLCTHPRLWSTPRTPGQGSPKEGRQGEWDPLLKETLDVQRTEACAQGLTAPALQAGALSPTSSLPPHWAGRRKGRLGPWEAGCSVGTVALEAVAGGRGRGAGFVPSPRFSIR